MAYSSTILSNWHEFLRLMNGEQTQTILLGGNVLSLANIVAVSQFNKQVDLNQDYLKRVEESADEISIRLAAGDTIYAVNTGVGASAALRTNDVEDLQQAIIRTLNCGIINNTNLDYAPPANSSTISTVNIPQSWEQEADDNLPFAWTKAAILLRITSLLGGNSGVRVELLQSLIGLLQHNITPCIPLRGSISASGDLSPLSYLAGAIQGNPGINVWVTTGDTRRMTSADVALREVGMQPIRYAPKEALALVNGTSVSAGAAALNIQDAHGCMALAQVLTAMAVESLNGTVESFDPHFSEVRPHPGQREAAHNILSLLSGSKLAREPATENVDGLLQDRYALRTSPQWLGPELENMLLAHSQILIECNSITDNPLVKENGEILQGGNFQALSVTSAMDKTRAALSNIGRMLFQQSAELMNPATNNGLPPNLTANEPSTDFLFKGLDIASASYQSELAFLSHSTSPFVIAAEQGNQSLNSLALVSTRYTSDVIDLYMRLCANSLLALCQALDLRAIQQSFESTIEPLFYDEVPSYLKESLKLSCRAHYLLQGFLAALRKGSSLDLEARIREAMSTVLASAITTAQGSSDVALPSEFYVGFRSWSTNTTDTSIAFARKAREQHSIDDTLKIIGRGSRRMYEFVRRDLGVPFLKSGIPGPQGIPTFEGMEIGTTIGTFTSRIYLALKRGTLFVPVMDCLDEASRFGRLDNTKLDDTKLEVKTA